MLVVGMALVGILSACTTNSSPPGPSPTSSKSTPPVGTIVGSFRSGGGPAGGLGGPLSGTVTVSAHNSGRSAITAPIDATGEFRVRLAPGRYTLTAIAPRERPCHAGPTPPQRAVVAAGRLTRVKLVCPVG